MGSHVTASPGSTGSGGDEEEVGDYCLATYIRQNSENLQRLHSVTESVCHTEEERRLIDQELLQASSHPADHSSATTTACTCSGAEYCSSACKDADKYKQLVPTKSDTAPPVRGQNRVKFFRSKSHTCTGAFSCKCPRHKIENKRVKDFKIDLPPISSESSIDGAKPGKWWTLLKWTGAILGAVLVTASLTWIVCSLVLQAQGTGSRTGRPVNYSEVAGEAKQTLQPIPTYRSQDKTVTDSQFDHRREDYVSFFLDTTRFSKGDSNLRWTTDEPSREFTLMDDDCIRLERTAHYQIYSKITFVFESIPMNTTNSVYHNVQLVRNESREMLEKDYVTIPPPSLRKKRVLKSSLVLVLQKFQAGDVICVTVQDTNLVYASKIDSSLKIIRKL